MHEVELYHSRVRSAGSSSNETRGTAESAASHMGSLGTVQSSRERGREREVEREVERERQTLPFLFSAEDAGREKAMQAMHIAVTVRACGYS